MKIEEVTAPAADQPTTEAEVSPDVPAIKRLRKAIDILLQDLKTLDKSRERALSITKLQEAIMWLGMDLKRMGTPNPYPHSYDASSPVIDPVADDLKL